jgi:hypothetical protein
MSDSDDLAKFRPRIGKRPLARERVASGSLRVASLVRLGHGRVRTNRRARVPVAPDGFGPRHNARRVIVKAHLQRLTRYGAQAALGICDTSSAKESRGMVRRASSMALKAQWRARLSSSLA